MKSRSLYSVVVACALAVSAFASAAVDIAVSAAHYSAHWARKCVLGFVEVIAGPAAPFHTPAVRLVQAKEYVARLIRRDRPVITQSWRICSST